MGGGSSSSPWRARARAVRLALVLGTLALALSASAVAGPAFRPGHVRVAPATGRPDTVFELGFTTPERTGVSGTTQRHDFLSASAPAGSRNCITSVSLRTPDAPAHAHVRVKLRPGRLGGRWCGGKYTGQIEEIESGVCPRHSLCPTFAVLRGTVGRFSFRVKASPQKDAQAPSFGGLQHASACTPGAQRPGQTTPYTLTWQAATDNVTPSSQIIYRVYYATAAGSEDYGRPSWTTEPGVTSFRTPGLPSHGAAYFVVRARDLAGNEDRNTVEQPGMDLCL